MQIAGSYAEVLALLERLRGRHVRSAAERRAVVLIATFVTVACLAGGIRALTQDGSGAVAIALCALGPLFALWLIADHYATIEISDAGIEKRMPIRGRVWHIAPGDIRDVELSMERGGYLKINTAEGARGIELFDSLAAALGIAVAPKPLPKTLGTIAYTALAVVVIAVAVTIWILAAKGLFEW